MVGLSKTTAKLLLVIGVSLLLGFFVGNLTDFSVRRLNPFSKWGNSFVNQISFADVADRVNPSVVSVVSTKILDLNQLHEGFEFWSPLKPEEKGKRKSLGFGSGFVVDSRG